jgi:hypothetical protein
MATVIRPKISEKNKYYIDKHRYYELKHFCLQYKEWKKAYELCNDSIIFTANIANAPCCAAVPSDLTAKYAIRQAEYASKIRMIEKAAMEADDFLYKYILKAVTEGLSYTYLKSSMEIPCGKDMYYDRYRRFFWLLSNARN